MRIRVLSAAIFLITTSANGNNAGYFAPGDIPAAGNHPNITVRQLDDHTEIDHRIPGNAFADHVTESRWEDGSDFLLLKGNAQISRIREATPYWGYSKTTHLRIFFVDDPISVPSPIGAGHRQTSYPYTLLTDGHGLAQAFECVFRDFQKLKSDARERALEAEGYDGTPYLISRYLAGAGARDRECKHIKWPA